MMQAPRIETPHLILRPHTAADFPALHAIWSEPAVYAHIMGKPPTMEESWSRLLRYAGHWALLGFGFWAVEEISTGLFIGDAGLANFHRDVDPPFGASPEMGWVLAAHSHGKGYGSEALRAIIVWAGDHLEATSYGCMIAPENTASLALAAKLGFRETCRSSYHGAPAVILQLQVKS